MKKVCGFMLVLLLTVVLLPINAEAATVIAEGTCGDDLTWVLDDTGTLTVSGAGAMDGYSDSSAAPWFTKRSKITSVVIGKGVTKIGNYAFAYCLMLERVSIADTVTEIGWDAFRECTKLTEVVIPDGVVRMWSSVFEGCTGLKYVTLPANITEIGWSLFRDCSSLETVVLPVNLKEIASELFRGCAKLKEIVLPQTVTDIGSYAFQSCTGLERITLPDSVTDIGMYAFSGCTALTDIVLPEQVAIISSNAFYGCGLTEITIPENVTTVAFCAFEACDELKQITFTGDAPEIGSNAFAGVTATAYYPEDNFTWTDSVKQNYGGSILWLIKGSLIASGSCGDELIWTLDEAGTLTISGRGEMTEIGWHEYDGQIKTAVIGGGVTGICELAFYGCENLTGIEVASGNARYSSDSNGALYNKAKTELIVWPAAYNGSAVIPSAVTKIWSNAFAYCDSMTSVLLPTYVTTLGDSAFYECDGLTAITIPAGVTEIGEWPFAYCDNLRKIRVSPDNRCYSSDSNGALYDKEKTELIVWPSAYTGAVTIPDTVTDLLSYAIYDCDGVTSITVPSSVCNIQSEAIAFCSGLETVVFKGNAPKMHIFAFFDTATTARYPKGDSSWTSAVMQNYGGSVNWVGYETLKITRQPQDAYTQFGKKISLSVKAEGEGLRYAWYVKDVTDPDFVLSNITSDTYAPVMTEDKSGRYVYCVITDKFGNALTTDTVRLWLTATITQQPASVTVIQGDTAKVTVRAVGDGLHYRWYYKNAGENSYTYTPSFKGNTYYVTMNEARNGRQLLCRVYDQYGNVVQSNMVRLSMETDLDLWIVKQPQDSYAQLGQKANVSVKVEGDGLRYEWYVRNVTDREFLLSGITSDTYAPVMTEDKTGGYVYCVVYDQYGNSVTTETVRLWLTATITKQPVSGSVPGGEMIRVTVQAAGDGLTYRWYYKNAGESSYTYTSTFKGNTYRVEMNEARNGRQVLCRVYDQYGNVVQSNTVKLTMKNVVKITQQPVSVAVAEGATAKVTVRATGDGLTYRWYFKDAGDSSYTYTASYTGNTYSVPMTEARNGRQLLCRVYDRYGNVVQSNTVILRIR